jgi:ferredoxin, 2Fe-2S
MYSIAFYVAEEASGTVVLHQIKAGQTILEIALAHNIHLQHQCGGVCTCTTCHIYIHSGSAYVAPPSRRETHFLQKVMHRKAESRLACQCLLLNSTGNIVVAIPPQRY